MKKVLPSAVFGLLLLLCLSIPLSAWAQAQTVKLPPRATFSGPFNSGNLSVYLIHGEDKLKNANILTLDEAMQQKQVVVHETSNVNELSVENKSTAFVFLQSGDIVRGGRQDRTLQYDMMLPPKSGKVALPSFCVEQGRWSQRGGETVGAFSGSKNSLSGKNLKLAAKRIASQSIVWDEVTKQQTKLSQKVGASVSAKPSPSSFELTMEHDKVAKATENHVKALSNVVQGKKDVIGYAFAINGKINSADIYANSQLFTKLWPKLLKSSAVEAVGEIEAGKEFAPPPVKSVEKFIAEGKSGSDRLKHRHQTSSMVERENDQAVYYGTTYTVRPAFATGGGSGSAGAAPVARPKQVNLHENYLAK